MLWGSTLLMLLLHLRVHSQNQLNDPAVFESSFGQADSSGRIEILRKILTFDSTGIVGLINYLQNDSNRITTRVDVVKTLAALSSGDLRYQSIVTLVLGKFLNMSPSKTVIRGPTVTYGLNLYDTGKPSSSPYTGPSSRLSYTQKPFVYNCKIREAAITALWKTDPFVNATLTLRVKNNSGEYSRYIYHLLDPRNRMMTSIDTYADAMEKKGGAFSDSMNCKWMANVVLIGWGDIDDFGDNSSTALKGLIDLLEDSSIYLRQSALRKLESYSKNAFGAERAAWLRWLEKGKKN